MTPLAAEPLIEYPDSDGKPMADNTLQFEWIVTIKGNLDLLFANDPNVFVAGDNLIVLGEKGDVSLVEPTPEKFTEKARFKIDSARCWTMPTVAQGRLYIRDEEKLYRYDLQAQ